MSPDAGGDQSVLGGEPVLLDRSQRVDDVGEQVENGPRVQKGIVYLNARQRRVLVLFDKRMVGVFRVGARTQVERVDGGKVEQTESSRVPAEEYEIVFNEVVADESGCSVGRLLECGKGLAKPAAFFSPGASGRDVGAYCPDRIDAVPPLEVDRQKAGEAVIREALPYLPRV
ncbi:MAG: hypothetical protein OYK82_14085 [Gammaproteobacteria bacterium]|nr:hypothetical protein [Gammaproteobacteria bacterium]